MLTVPVQARTYCVNGSKTYLMDFHKHLGVYLLGLLILLVSKSLHPPDFTLKFIIPNVLNKIFWTNTDKVLVRPKNKFGA